MTDEIERVKNHILIYGIDGFVFIETARTNGVQIVIDVEIERAKELLAQLAAAIQKAEVPQ